jgi:flavin-dependent dehydrogenase
LTSDYDLAIAGAGPAGAATALYAARAGMRVAVFDRATFPRDKICGEGLMPPGRAALAELGLTAQMEEAEAQDLLGVEFGMAGAPTYRVAFPRGPAIALGLGVRRLRFDALLAERLADESDIAFHPATPVSRVAIKDGGDPALMTGLGEVRARHVVIADGLRSSLRQQLGWTVGPKRPHRYGVMAHWSVDREQDPWIRITIGSGFEVYEAPVGARERLVGILCHRSRMNAFSGRLADEYQSIAGELVPALARASRCSEVRATGPFNYRARTVARDGVFLVGDAAGFVDPISAEGLAAALTQAGAVVRALHTQWPEAAYRAAHRRLTRDPRRVSALLMRLAATPSRAARGIRAIDRRPQIMAAMLGVNFGYWGFERISLREWVRLFTGR